MLFYAVTSIITAICVVRAVRTWADEKLILGARRVIAAVYLFGALIFAVGGSYLGPLLEAGR